MARGIHSAGTWEAPQTHSSTENEHASFLECWASRSLMPWTPRARRPCETAQAQVPRGQDIPGGQDRKRRRAELRAVSPPATSIARRWGSYEPIHWAGCGWAAPARPSNSRFWEGRERRAAGLDHRGRRAAGLHTHTVTLGPRRLALGS